MRAFHTPHDGGRALRLFPSPSTHTIAQGRRSTSSQPPCVVRRSRSRRATHEISSAVPQLAISPPGDQNAYQLDQRRGPYLIVVDAEFLVGLASRADELRAALQACQQREAVNQ